MDDIDYFSSKQTLERISADEEAINASNLPGSAIHLCCFSSKNESSSAVIVRSKNKFIKPIIIYESKTIHQRPVCLPAVVYGPGTTGNVRFRTVDGYSLKKSSSI